ncbi:MAG TPA: glycerophosphodiester phosphodiesterase [Porticoccaceae bacterium]|nr:glycerophosphodiester phosphodiesterase [Porticoccaceae bacterium]HCO61147.1 glycerophosphodiester phosphodiesterase [Porticoccaceae bacterium]
MDPKQLVAHRGYQALYPENTLLAYRKAIAAGALFLETDIQFSADIQPILYHDLKLKRVSGKAGLTTDHPLRSLVEFSAHEPKRLGQHYIEEKISPLSALVRELEQHPKIFAYIEIKEEAIAFVGIKAAYTAISQCLQSVATQCHLISYDYSFILHARNAGWERCGVVLKKWRDLKLPVIEAIAPGTIFCNHKKIPRNAQLNHLEPELVVFEITDTRLASQWLDRGADKIETFDIGTMIDT